MRAMSEFWPGRRVLVTGGTGFLGSAVCRRLAEVGADEVHAVGSADYDLRRADETARLFDELRPELVLHLAAQVGGIGMNRARPADLYLENLLMGTWVIEEARRRGTEKLVVVGTACSYPKFAEVPFHESALFTGYPEESNAPYGLAKLAHLVQIQANRAQHGQRAIYVVPTNLFGPGDDFDLEVSHVIPALLRKAVEARESGADEIVVWGTGAASREFLYVDDAARGLVLAAEHYDSPEPVNLGVDREVPIKELVETIVELVGFEGRIVWDDGKPDGQPRRRIDATRAREAFGFRAEVGLAEGLRRTLDWYRGQREG